MITIPGFTPPPSGYSGPGGAPAVTWILQNSTDGSSWTDNGTNNDWSEIVKLFNSMIAQAEDRWWRVIDSNGVVDQAHNFIPKGKVEKHVYLIQTSPNKEGLVWTTVYQDDDQAGADADYNTGVATGGWWQMLVDGAMTKTNLPVDQRYEAQKKKEAEEYLRDIWSLEALVGGAWSWLADSDSLAEAKAKLNAVRTGTFPASIPESTDLRITDKHGAVVATDKGKQPQTVFFNVQQSPTTDMAKWVLKTGPYNSYGLARTAMADIIRTEPNDVLRIVDTTGKVYDIYKGAGAQTGPLAGTEGLMVGLVLVIVLAGLRSIME